MSQRFRSGDGEGVEVEDSTCSTPSVRKSVAGCEVKRERLRSTVQGTAGDQLMPLHYWLTWRTV